MTFAFLFGIIKVMKAKHKKPKQKASEELSHKTKIRIVGIGGGGGSIVSEISSQLKKVDFVAANTDIQALRQASKNARIMHFGQSLTRGLGCGMDPKCGQKSAKDEEKKIVKLFEGVDLVVLVASLGGGTGSGAVPEFAKIAKDLGVMTFGICTLPFKFEGARRMQIAKNSLERLTPYLNALSVIPNENIFQMINKDTPIMEAFSTVNRKLAANLRGMIEMVYLSGLINIDFADLRTILTGKGKLAYLNTSMAQGPNRAEEAVKDLLKSPLNEYSLGGAEKIVFNVTASDSLGMLEVEQISKTISDSNKRAKIIFGVCQDQDYKDRIRITLLGVGCEKEPEKKNKQESKPKIEAKPEPKPATKPKPKKKKSRTKIKPKQKKNIQKPAAPEGSEPRHGTWREPPKEISKVLIRKNALDIQKEAEKTEEELLDQEKVWDIPTFLRKQEER